MMEGRVLSRWGTFSCIKRVGGTATCPLRLSGVNGVYRARLACLVLAPRLVPEIQKYIYLSLLSIGES